MEKKEYSVVEFIQYLKDKPYGLTRNNLWNYTMRLRK